LKPNILTDISKENWSVIPAISHTYRSAAGGDQTMLEDESGRIRLIGSVLESDLLVTGCIIGVLGSENEDGSFEILEVKVPDLPPQPRRWLRTEVNKAPKPKDGSSLGKIAFVSGLSFSGERADTLASTLLLEYLLGEAGGQTDHEFASKITRLVIVGNSIAQDATKTEIDEIAKKPKKYGYDATAYNPSPMQQLDSYISALLPSMPVTLMPGLTDPANVALPQQPLHHALFPQSRYYTLAPPKPGAKPNGVNWFDSVSNPWQGDIAGLRVLVTAGQTLDDVFRYVLPQNLGAKNDKSLQLLEVAEKTLRWRVLAPTAPDTLWCYPFQEDDPFVVRECPHVYVIGNQEKFVTSIIDGDQEQRVRIVTIPKFRETGQIVLMDLETADVEVVEFDV